MSVALWQSVGGKERVAPRRNSWSTFRSAGGSYWDFGWIEPAERTDDENEKVGQAEQEILQTPFVVTGNSRVNESYGNITMLWSHPDVVAVLGHPYTGTHQLTGSCVGAGGGNVLASTNYVEAIKNGEPDKITLPFYPFTYGRSRYYMGDSGRGEGSTGTTYAKAAGVDGWLDNLSHAELPKPKNSDALVWGREVEMEWSAGGRTPCTTWIPLGQKNTVKTVSKLTSASQVREALLNYYAVTEASMYGFNPAVKNGVLMGTRGPRWSHQMSFHGFWDHPQNGPIYLLMNQWGQGAHGTDPSGKCPPGGVWIPEADVEWICRSDGEVFSFSGTGQGYPAPTFVIPWDTW